MPAYAKLNVLRRENWIKDVDGRDASRTRASGFSLGLDALKHFTHPASGK